jgi:hypothetical protein
MSGVSLLTFLVIVWAAVTVVFIALMLWKAIAGSNEADILMLSPLEAAQASEQWKTIAKMERITSLAKGFGLASLALLIVTGAYWIYRGMTTFTGG